MGRVLSEGAEEAFPVLGVGVSPDQARADEQEWRRLAAQMRVEMNLGSLPQEMTIGR